MNTIIATVPMRSRIALVAITLLAGTAHADPSSFAQSPNDISQSTPDRTLNTSPTKSTESHNLIAVGNVGFGSPFRAIMLDYQLATGATIDAVPSSAFRAINAAKANNAMAIISRPLMAHEIDAGRTATRIGAEALVAVVHDDNPMRSISIDDVANIYQGKSRTWFNGRRITAFIPESCNADTSLYRQTILSSGFSGKEIITIGDDQVFHELRSVPRSIGLVPFSSLASADLGSLRILPISGVAPTNTTVFSGAYALSRPVCIVTDSAPTSQQQAFIDFCLNDSGQRAIAQSGRTPLPAPQFAYFDTPTESPDSSFAFQPDVGIDK